MTTPWPGGSELRIGDADREAAVSALGEHYAAGRLTKEEYDERAGAALTARTSADLWPLFTDLPRPAARGATRTPRPDAPGRPAPVGPYPGWRIGAWLVPMLVVVGALAVLAHPLVFLLLAVWLFWARSHGVWGHRRRWAHGHRHHHLR
jgi:hypothetical protein